MRDDAQFKRQEFGYAVIPTWSTPRPSAWLRAALYAVGVAGCVLAVVGVLVAFG